ncbi:MAG: rhodanese-like domain-containing protein [Planctomycetes bacterium]|nr:rhodanese-like domain-containing protein [Planctomycetota bacterium]
MRFLTQCLSWLATSLAFAFIANALHPAGLSWSRDYFHNSGDETNPKDHRFLSLSISDAKDWWDYRVDEIGGVYFVDARKASTVSIGHIPGSLNIDRYLDEDPSPDTLSKLQNASMVIVYCAGGDCEDSVFLAKDLVYRWQVPLDIVAIFEGGFEKWKEAGHPIEQ